VVLQASIAPLASHVSNHAKKFAHVTVKELVVVFDYVLQVLHMLLHRFHGLETFVDRRVEICDGLTTSTTTHRMQSEGVVIAIISTIIAAVVATSIVAAIVAVVVVVAAAVGAFRSPLLGLLIPNVEVVIISSGGRPRARATIIGVVATPLILRLGRHLLVVFALHALYACRPSNVRRDLLSFDGVARCDSSGWDTPSATDAGGLLDLDGYLELASLRLLHRWLLGFYLQL
jgi:hypothetical protein